MPTGFQAHFPHHKALLAAAICLLLGACAQQQASSPTAEAQAAPAREQPPEMQSVQVPPARQQAPGREEREEREAREARELRPFPVDTLYTLLVAEVAGNREHYDIALLNYYRQAQETRDAGVAARATHIARFLNARRAALRSSQLWAQLEPQDPDAHFAATAELTLAGDFDTALVHAKRTLELGGDAPLQSLAATAVGDEKVEKGTLEEFRLLAERYPQNGEAALAYAMVLRADEQYPQALSIVRRVQEQHPDMLDAPLLESHLLIDQDRRAEALQLMEKLVAVYPRESRLRLQYARLLIRKDLEKAQAQFAELVKQRPRDGNMILSLALIRYETNQLDLARPLLERLLELDQHESAAHYYLGQIAERESDLREAVIHYRQVEPGDDYVEAITRGTRLLAAAGGEEINRQWFAELRQRHPQQAEQFYLMEADLLRQQNLHEEALALVNSALEKNRESGRLIYTHALISEQVGNSADFEKGMRKLLERDPENATVLNALGYKLTEDESRLQEAHQMIGKALELEPDDPAIIDSMGWVEYRLGNHAEAVKHLRRALEKLPDHEIAAHLGEVLWKQGNREQAMEVWKRGLESNPRSAIIPAAMKRLQINESLEQHVSDS